MEEKKTKKKSEKSRRARKSLVIEDNVEELSEGNNSDDFVEPPSERIKGQKRKRSSTGGGVSSRTRARKAVSYGDEPVGEFAVQQESNPVRGTTVVSLSLDSESEDLSTLSSKERQPPQPLEMYFKSTQYVKTSKIQTKCSVKKTVDVIKGLKEEAGWFTSHPQFRHFFHMPDEEYMKLQAMWMLLMRTIRIEGEDAAWFAVNGVPIRYSMREHALISGLDCHDYPSRYLELGGTKFVDYYFGNKKRISIIDVEQKLLSMETTCNDRLKMAVLFFLGRLIRGSTKDSAPLDPFILRIVEDLDVCRKFPWGRLTFEDAIKEIKHVMDRLKGEVNYATTFTGFIIPLEVLAFECIPKLGKKFRISSEGASGDCPRMCKSRFIKSRMKGYPLEDIYAAFGNTKNINSVLVPTVDEEKLLARIIDLESEYHCEDSTSDRWNYWLNVKQKKIWWKELYEADVAARVFKKEKDNEKVTIEEGSSSNSGLESMLKGMEERIVKAMEEGFSGINLTVETKLEAMNWTMCQLEKSQRILKRRAKKIEDRLTSIEDKGNEDVEYRQWSDFDYGDHGKDREMADAGKDKEKTEAGKKNNEEEEENNGKDEEKVENEKNSEKDEDEEEKKPEEDRMEESDEEDPLLIMREQRRIEANDFWDRVDQQDAEEEAEMKRVQAEEEAEMKRVQAAEMKRVQAEEEAKIRRDEAEKEVEMSKDVEEEAEEEAERRRVEADIEWRRVCSESDSDEKKSEETEVEKAVETEAEIIIEDAVKIVKAEKKSEDTTKAQAARRPSYSLPLRGRTKAQAARRNSYSTPEEWMAWKVVQAVRVEESVEIGVEEVVETGVKKAVETEVKEAEETRVKKTVETVVEDEEKIVEEEEEKDEEESEKEVEEEKKDEEAEAEKYTEEEKQGWYMVVYKESTCEATKPDELPAMVGKHHRPKVMAVKGGITRAERLAKMKQAKAKAQGTPKKRGRPKKTAATLKPCTPLPEKRKAEPSRWVQSPFTEGKTDELEVPKKKLKTKR